MLRRLTSTCFASLLVAAPLLHACTPDAPPTDGIDSETSPDLSAPDTTEPDVTEPDTPPEGPTPLPGQRTIPPIRCGERDVTRADGTLRGQIPPPIELPTMGDQTISWNPDDGRCGSLIILPAIHPVSELDPTPLWQVPGALTTLMRQTLPETQWLFVVIAADATEAAAERDALWTAIEDARAALDTAIQPDDTQFQVLEASYHDLRDQEHWIADAFAGPFPQGLALGYDKVLRGLGSFADVNLFDPALEQAELWPWKSNLVYANWEAIYLDTLEAIRTSSSSFGGISWPIFSAEILEGEASRPLLFPENIADYDTLEVSLHLQCPDPQLPEMGNCGAWDYLARLFVRDTSAGEDAEEWEIARFITAYHRETEWRADITPLLAKLQPGAQLELRWEFAPPWNVQPTLTTMHLHASQRDRGIRPREIIPLYRGGPYGPGFHAERPAQELTLPAQFAKAELHTLVTGHGAETDQCAEFCNIRHSFEINEHSVSKHFLSAGFPDACVAEVREGMVPNQGGTWWFGRGGWCPGAAVKPWIEDITPHVTPGGTLHIDYQALRGGREPESDHGVIELTTVLVLYE